MGKLSKRELRKREIRKTIIQTTEKLFLDNGYKGTSMNEISEKSTYTKRTIYKYFISKEDLFFAVLLVRIKELHVYIKDKIKDAETGHHELDIVLNSLYYLYRHFSPTIPLLSMLESVRKKGSAETTPYEEQFNTYTKDLFLNVGRIYKSGINDGSMRDDLDSRILTYSSVFTFVGMLGILNMIGEEFLKEQGINEEEFIQATLQLQLDSVKNKNSL